MIKETKYNGYTAVPSDYECTDGDLATAVNVIPEDGATQPLLPPKVLFKLSDTQDVVYIHTTSSYTHYIVYDTADNKMYWMNSTAKSLATTDNYLIGTYELVDINAIGNTLLVFEKTKINHHLWKSGKYKSLGPHLPELTISFGLVGHPRLYSLVKEDGSSDRRGTFTIDFDDINESELYNTFSDDNKSKITSQVMAKVNKFIAEQTTNKGRFCFPFFVRWAYRLFDGSHTMHSAPILMCPSTTPAPIVLWKHIKGENGKATSAELDIMMVAADLDYAIPAQDEFGNLSDWEDIITGIDIFVSKPIYTYDQSGECSSFNDEDNFDCKFIGRLYNGEKDEDKPDTTVASEITEDRMLGPFADTAFMEKYMEYSYHDIYSMYFSTDRHTPATTLNLPEFSDDKRDESIESTANFFKLAYLELGDLKTDTRKIVPIDDEYLQSLINREAMNDDYLSHDNLMATQSSVYNSRLNLTGVSRTLFDGFKANAMFAFCNDVYILNYDETDKKTLSVTLSKDLGTFFTSYGRMIIRVYIRENNEVYSVTSRATDMPYLKRFVISSFNRLITSFFSDGTKKITYWNFDDGTKTVTFYNANGEVASKEVKTNIFYPLAWGSWLFYPNANAFKIAIWDENVYVNSALGSYYGHCTFECELKAHDYLNGAFAFIGFKSQRGNESTVGSLPTVTARGNVSTPSKVYTSEVNNPFYFPVTGINTVGTGKILGICTAAKALSQGQFGQFPLYAFSTEGVWALEVSSTGSYSAKQPITRDVCTNVKSLTQMDSSVLFVTDRGIMQISGSNTVCLSDIIDTEFPFALSDLPKYDVLLSTYNKLVTDETEQLTLDNLSLLPFRTFLKDCRMIYDYTHQRIVVYNPSCKYAYVYSILSTAWGMMRTNITSDVNSYPDALAMDGNHQFVNVSATDATSVPVLWVSRPFKFGEPDVFKTIDTIIQRGKFRTGHLAQVLYGSNDLYNWHAVWSSKDQYLRGFRGTPYKFYRLAVVGSLNDDETVYGFTTQYTPRLANQPR